MKKTYITIITLVTAYCFLPVEIFAQGPPGPPATPIDGGLSILLAAGGVYGLKKMRDYQKKQKEL